MTIKIISVMQPYADLIVSGRKRIENRSWPTNHRGPLAIHASRSRTAWLNMSDADADDWWPDWRKGESPIVGGVIGIVDLVDCLPPDELPDDLRRHEFTEHGSAFCWVLSNARRIDPVAMPGRTKLWSIELPKAALAGAR